MGCSVQGVGFRHRARVSLGFSVWDVGFRVWALGSGARLSLGFSLWDVGFRV